MMNSGIRIALCQLINKKTLKKGEYYFEEKRLTIWFPDGQLVVGSSSDTL